MKNIILVLSITILLSGCSWFGKGVVKNSFPDVPEKLMEAPRELATIRPAGSPRWELTDDSASDIPLSTVIKISTENYKAATLNKEQLKLLQEWVAKQKKLNP